MNIRNLGNQFFPCPHEIFQAFPFCQSSRIKEKLFPGKIEFIQQAIPFSRIYRGKTFNIDAIGDFNQGVPADTRFEILSAYGGADTDESIRLFKYAVTKNHEYTYKDHFPFSRRRSILRSERSIHFSV